jgi:hypothetical protein
MLEGLVELLLVALRSVLLGQFVDLGLEHSLALCWLLLQCSCLDVGNGEEEVGAMSPKVVVEVGQRQSVVGVGVLDPLMKEEVADVDLGVDFGMVKYG